eukprot:UN05249
MDAICSKGSQDKLEKLMKGLYVLPTLTIRHHMKIYLQNQKNPLYMFNQLEFWHLKSTRLFIILTQFLCRTIFTKNNRL